MSPKEIVEKLRKHRNEVQAAMWRRSSKYEYSNDLFQNLSNELNIAKDVIGASDADFYAYIIARLKHEV